MTEVDAISLAKKALKDIGHWEDFKIEKARIFEKDPPYDYRNWLVSFHFTEQDWFNGEIAPMVIVNDEEEIVTFVSWKMSKFLLRYDKEKDKYWHKTLSR